jgi:hypothetical protein
MPARLKSCEIMCDHDVRHVLVTVGLQKLKMRGDLVDHGLGSRTDSEYCRTTTGDLSTTGIVDNLSADTQADSLGLEDQQVLLALDLYSDLCLTVPLPALEDWRVLA